MVVEQSPAVPDSGEQTQSEQPHSAPDAQTTTGTNTPLFPPPLALSDNQVFVWDENEPAVENYRSVGRRLARTGDLYRSAEYGGGLLLAPDSPGATSCRITQGSQLAPVIVDRLRVQVVKDGKLRAGHIPAAHLNTMLASEAFLQEFRPVDEVVSRPRYLENFDLTCPGYNDGGPGQRILHLGKAARVSDSLDAIHDFLDVMAFASDADRTNAVAAALTVLLRHLWPGGKPVIIVTSTKSHGGKDTVIQFARGGTTAISISHESADWALEKTFVSAMKNSPDCGMVVVENVRLGRARRLISSAFLERTITNPEMHLYSPGAGFGGSGKNQVVIAMSTNFGSVSEDLMNRALPIHLSPVGNVADRESPIGNPKLEYLPKNYERIEAELRGMVERWQDAGMRPDPVVRHPFTAWARTVGGILWESGFDNFLDNYAERRTVDDPERQALAILGAARPGEWLRPGEWARIASLEGLVKALVSDAERDSERGRERGMGVVLSRHEEETFKMKTENECLTLRLKWACRRFETGQEPSSRYCFFVEERQPITVDQEDATGTPDADVQDAG